MTISLVALAVVMGFTVAVWVAWVLEVLMGEWQDRKLRRRRVERGN